MTRTNYTNAEMEEVLEVLFAHDVAIEHVRPRRRPSEQIRLFREAEARDHAALEAEAERIRAANDRHPPLRRDLIWLSPLLIAGATVALIVLVTLLARGMVG